MENLTVTLTDIHYETDGHIIELPSTMDIHSSWIESLYEDFLEDNQYETFVDYLLDNIEYFQKAVEETTDWLVSSFTMEMKMGDEILTQTFTEDMSWRNNGFSQWFSQFQ